MPEFQVFPWEDDEDGTITRAWETGTTGFPIVDAAMRQLLREGWLHNRMRFLAASFYCKYLLLPWPVGAAHLVRTLVDGDEACNSLGWRIIPLFTLAIDQGLQMGDVLYQLFVDDGAPERFANIKAKDSRDLG